MNTFVIIDKRSGEYVIGTARDFSILTSGCLEDAECFGAVLPMGALHSLFTSYEVVPSEWHHYEAMSLQAARESFYDDSEVE